MKKMKRILAFTAALALIGSMTACGNSGSSEPAVTTAPKELDKEDKEQADALVAKFQDIFKDTIGDIKPLAPKQTQKRDEEYLASIPKVKI